MNNMGELGELALKGEEALQSYDPTLMQGGTKVPFPLMTGAESFSSSTIDFMQQLRSPFFQNSNTQNAQNAQNNQNNQNNQNSNSQSIVQGSNNQNSGDNKIPDSKIREARVSEARVRMAEMTERDRERERVEDLTLQAGAQFVRPEVPLPLPLSLPLSLPLPPLSLPLSLPQSLSSISLPLPPIPSPPAIARNVGNVASNAASAVVSKIQPVAGNLGGLGGSLGANLGANLGNLGGLQGPTMPSLSMPIMNSTFPFNFAFDSFKGFGGLSVAPAAITEISEVTLTDDVNEQGDTYRQSISSGGGSVDADVLGKGLGIGGRRAQEMRNRPGFMENNRVPLPTKADLNLILSRRVAIAVTAAMSCQTLQDAKEYQREIGLKSLISAITETQSNEQTPGELSLSGIKGVCRLIRIDNSIAVKVVAVEEVVTALCNAMEAPLKVGAAVNIEYISIRVTC